MNERIAELSLRRQGLITIEQRYEQYHNRVQNRLEPFFQTAGVAYPPTRLVLVAIKTQKVMEVYAAADGPMRFIRTYPILAASGLPGPKLREGDRQVPEGVYGIEKLNPNSRYHLALRVAYPNGFDCEIAADEHRTNLGSDIMIHGSHKSAGCLAMGDPASEDLFILGAEVGVTNIKLIISPVDFRTTNRLPADTRIHPWSAKLYAQIKTELYHLPITGR
jgi:murein L,D-transpeptidase YafK